MSTPPYLSDAQVERLGEILDLRAVPSQGLNLEALDGFLSAIAVSPDPITGSEWQSQVWGNQPPRWRDPEEKAEAEALLMGHWNTCVDRVRNNEDELPEHLSPLLWLPEEPEAEQPDELDVGRDWAHGFFRAVELRSDAWQRLLDGNDWVDEIFSLLEQLATGEAEPEPGEAPEPTTFRERMEIVASLPGMLADLHQHRVEQASTRAPAS